MGNIQIDKNKVNNKDRNYINFFSSNNRGFIDFSRSQHNDANR